MRNDDLEPNNEPEDDLSGTNLPEEESEENGAIRNESSNSSRKRIQETLSKSTTKNAATKSLIKVLLPILTWVLVFIIILIIIIGVVLFFITMPGMVMDKLKELSKNVGKGIAAFFGADTTKQVDDEEICDVLDYLEQMGYDLKGYGFLTDYVGEEDGEGVERYTAEEAESKEGKSEGDIKEAKSDFIFTYLVSDNYVYTIANFNQTTGGNGSFWQSIFTAIKSVLLKMGNILTRGQLGQHWGRGMIELYDEQKDIFGNSVLGKKGDYYSNGLFDKIKIKIDEEKNKRVLSIKRGIGGETLEYNLDGWTGRYGMPIDFLLSIHLATMMPDLAYDMVESFDTKITLLLHNDFPYIAYVKDHWYRDVYFVKNLDDKEERDLEFVDYDYDYESLMKERWTLYETYEENEVGNDKSKVGEYKLYEINEDGTYKEENGKPKLFDGTAEDAEKQGIKVAKKAKTINYEDEEQFEDVKWNKVRDSLWSAYKLTNEGNIKQTGEGLRTETNPEIKKMFLENQYFRYDGSSETAEKITELRKKISKSEDNLYYGPVKGINPDGEEVDYTDTEIEDDENEGQKIKISDLSGTVSLNQDSLNAFSMLENEHTLDADYIYRDFKELIVELGYFEKEELTDETPRLLEFLVPEIGSYLYPKRSIDKNENEYGTMIHSKGDIDANNYKTLVATYQRAELERESGVVDENIGDGDKVEENPSNENNVSQPANNESLTNVGGMVQQLNSNINITQTVGGMGFNFERIAESGDGYDFKVKTGSVEYTHYYQFKGSYCNEKFYWGGSLATIHSAACGPTSCVNVLTGYGLDVNPTKNIVGIKFNPTIAGIKEFMEQYGVTGESYSGLSDAEYTSKIEEAFSEGKPIITLMHASKTGDTFWTSGGHFVPMVGQDTNGNIITLDPGSSREDRHTYTGGIQGLMTTLDAVWIADEAPDGMSGGELYEGYLGNEAVVSPVTGILLEYGTYTDEDVDSVSGEKYRTNVDLKYPQNVLESEESNQQGETQVDKVGYAKILVLDNENYKKIEKELLPETRWKNDGSFLNENGTYKDKDNLTLDEIKGKVNGKVNKDETWTDIERSLYGYKEFAERYEEAGISGYVVYIDGFKCEKPDEQFDNKNKMELEGKSPEGEELTMDSFREVTLNNFDSDGNITDKKDLLDSLYEEDDDYKLASKRATEKLKAENYIKKVATPSLYFGSDDLILLKEGTVIGRTLTDYELIVDYRHQEYRDFRKEEQSIEENDVDEIIGNYIRIIMRDLDKTVVENVEDYMKLDDNLDDGLGNIEEFMYWQAMECEGFHYDLSPEISPTIVQDGHVCRRDNPSDKYGHDYAVCNGGAGDLNLCPGVWLGFPGKYYSRFWKNIYANDRGKRNQYV